MKKNGLLAVIFLMASFTVSAQETGNKEKTADGLKGAHQVTVSIGHSHVMAGIKENGKKGWKVLPSTGLDYGYWISNHWNIGLYNEIIIENFEVEDHNNKVIERHVPVSSVVSGIYKPGTYMSYMLGMGAEFEKQETFALTRIGVEAAWEIKNDWEFLVSLIYDFKWGGYDTWGFGFGISKLFKKKRK